MNPSNVPVSVFQCPKIRHHFLKVLLKYREIYRSPTPPTFLCVIQDFLNDYEATGKADWELLTLAVKSFHLFCDGYNTDPFYEFIFDTLEELKCRDHFALQFCLGHYFRDRLKEYGFGERLGGSVYLHRIYTFSPNRIRIPIHDYVLNYDPIVIELNPFILHDNQVYLRFLRYGVNIDVTRIHELDDYTNTLTGTMTIRQIMWFYRNHDMYDRIHTMMRLIFEVSSAECPRRLALTMLTIDSLMQFEFFKNIESINSLQLFFRTITDAYVTLDEMFSIIWRLRRRFRKRERKDIKNLSKSYKGFFPQAAQSLQPRSLKHLCRVQVRQCMIEANSIHFGVPELRISKKLENYLLLKE